MSWIALLLAGLFETVWALALKESDAFTKPAPTMVFAAAMIVSIALLAWALRTLPVGTGYAVWTGTGAVGAVLAGIVVLGEPATLGRLAPIGLIAAGIAWLALAEG